MKCIIYARISTNKEKQNIKQQIEYCKSYAEKNDLEVLKIFKDSKTGKSAERRGYKLCIAYLKENPYVSLLVQDTDRLTRDFYDGVELERFVIENKIKIISISEIIDLHTPNGRFMFRIKLAMNNFYVENLVDKIKVGNA